MSGSRRSFLAGSAVVSAFGLATRSGRADAPSERVRVGIMGAGGRALSLIDTFSRNPSVDVVAIADLDANRLPKGLARAAQHQGRQPRGESDFRKLIDDRSIDALVIGTPGSLARDTDHPRLSGRQGCLCRET